MRVYKPELIMEKVIIGYRCISDCTLEYNNYEEGEVIEIPDPEDADDGKWPGTEFFDNHPYEFEPIYN